MRIERMTWPAAEAYFKENDCVLLSVGSIECHGRHLPLGTDYLIPQRLLELIEPKTDWVIAPTLPFGACEYLKHFPGTVSLGQDVLYDVLKKIIDGFRAHGARRFAVLNGHGGNSPVLERIGLELREQGCMLAQLNWWLMAWDLDPAWKGGHGGGEETAGILGVDPTLVDWSAVGDMELHGLGPDMPSTGFKGVLYKGVEIPIPRLTHEITDNGWIGPDHPNTATEEWGRAMLQSCADYICDFLAAYRQVPLDLAPQV